MIKEAGFSQIILLVALLLGLFVTLFLVQKQTNLFPKASEVIQDYIVVLNDDVTYPQDTALDIAQKHGLLPEDVYTQAFKGFTVRTSDSKRQEIANDPRVKFTSEDKKVIAVAVKPRPTSSGQVTPTGVSRIGADSLTNKGTGVGVAVLDTGIELRNTDLKDNILVDKSCVKGARTGNDDNGHGTHVAGIIAALDNGAGVRGVAPEAKLAAVKVLDSAGVGTWSNVICGLDWAIANASLFKIKVVNLSLSGGGSSDNNCGNTNSDPLHLAICRARDAGLTVVAAAGNDGVNTSGVVPASYDDSVITVSALNDIDGKAGGVGGTNTYGADDSFPNFSNFGAEVDLAGPGVWINSTYLGGTNRNLDGTSQAAPHVSGAAALYLKSNPSANYSQVKSALISAGETLNNGHTDPSGKHPEPVVKASSL